MAVSIPIGFSHQLRRPHAEGNCPARPVSIPIGFSHQLRPSTPALGHEGVFSFNPYRVFSSAETLFHDRLVYCSIVSIPIGFSHQLRRPDLAPGEILLQVSIPIGFSHQLRRTLDYTVIAGLDMFQSLSGFLIS